MTTLHEQPPVPLTCLDLLIRGSLITLLAMAMLLGFAMALWAAPVTTILHGGDPANRVDLAILGDGYTAGELAQYASDVETFLAGFLAEPPYGVYLEYLNVHRLDVVSSVSGAGQGAPIDTALGAFYNCAGIQRLICVNGAKVNQVLLDSVSATQRDMVIVLVNDPEYGGSGGAVAVASVHPDVVDLVLHETGHSFGLLADEYATQPPACNA